jgi:hypothetical protein
MERSPGYFHGQHRAQMRFNFFLCFEVEHRNDVLSRETQQLVKIM